MCAPPVLLLTSASPPIANQNACHPGRSGPAFSSAPHSGAPGHAAEGSWQPLTHSTNHLGPTPLFSVPSVLNLAECLIRCFCGWVLPTSSPLTLRPLC